MSKNDANAYIPIENRVSTCDLHKDCRRTPGTFLVARDSSHHPFRHLPTKLWMACKVCKHVVTGADAAPRRAESGQSYYGATRWQRPRAVAFDGWHHIQYVTAEWKLAFLRQAREFLFFPLLPWEASKRVSIFESGTGSKPERLRSGSLQADLV